MLLLLNVSVGFINDALNKPWMSKEKKTNVHIKDE